MTKLVLIRHGQTDWNLEGRWQGQADPPLNSTGCAQAMRTAQELRAFEFSALYSSDLQRAYETAKIISDTLGIAFAVDPRLREVHLGAWQGMFSDYIRTNYPAAFREWHESPLTVQPPGGETITSLALRVSSFVNEIVALHPEEEIAIVSHELPIAVVRCRVARAPLSELRAWIPANGEWVQINIAGALSSTA